MELITIIVPIFNKESTLAACLETILNQSYTNLEILLINDGSTDSSPVISAQYAQRDSRIKLYNQTNQGVSSARNTGLAMAHGKYVVFVDGDDTVEIDYIQKLYEAIHNGDWDLAICGYQRIGKVVDTFIPQGDLSHNLYQDFYLLREFVFFIAAKIYKLDIIKQYNLKFIVDCNMAEDQFFNRAYYKHVGKYNYVAESLYHYHQYNNGLSRKLDMTSYQWDYKNLLANLDFYNKYAVANKNTLLAISQERLIVNYFQPNFQQYEANKEIFTQLASLGNKDLHYLERIIKSKFMLKLMAKYNWYWPLFLKMYEKRKWAQLRGRE